MSLLPSYSDATSFVEDEIVVTGSRSQRYLSDTAVPVQIIKKDRLEILGVTNLAGALSHMAGAYLTQTRKQGRSLNINGYSAKHLLIMVDGQPIVGQGEDLDLSLIPIEGIDRIEVVKGPMSAYYGSGAMGGVVNLISQAPLAKQGFSGQISVGTAVADTAYQQPVSKRISGRLHSQFYGIEFVQNEQQPVDYQKRTDQENLGEEIQQRVKFTGMGLWSGWKLQLSPTFEHLKREKRLIPLATVNGNQTQFYKNEQQSQSMQWLIQDEVDQWKFSGRYQNSTEQSGNTLRTAREAQRQLNSVAVLHHLSSAWQPQLLGEPIAWSLGLQWQQESLEQTTDAGAREINGDNQTQRLEASMHADWLYQNTELGFSTRAIKDDRFDAVWIQQLQGKQALAETENQDWSLRYSIGQGYRAPTLKESYYVFDHRDLGYIMFGNQDLKPETSLMTQLGLMWQYRQVLQWQLNLAYDQIQHLIDMAATGSENGIALYQYRNINKAHLWSIETQMIYSPWADLELHMGYTYLDARDQESTPLTHRPRHNIRLGTQYQMTEQWSWLLNGQARSHEYYSTNAIGIAENNDRFLKKTAWLWDFASTYQFRSGVRVNVGVNNITDQRMDETTQGSFEDARPALGRVYQSSIQYNF